MDAKATDFVIKILTEYDLLQLSKAPDCFVNNARYILSKIYNLTHSIFKNFIINLLFQTFSSFQAIFGIPFIYAYFLDIPGLTMSMEKLSRESQIQFKNVRSGQILFRITSLSPQLLKIKFNQHHYSQNSCIDEAECKFFIYFTEEHYQPEKQKVCRLLR